MSVADGNRPHITGFMGAVAAGAPGKGCLWSERRGGAARAVGQAQKCTFHCRLHRWKVAMSNALALRRSRGQRIVCLFDDQLPMRESWVCLYLCDVMQTWGVHTGSAAFSGSER